MQHFVHFVENFVQHFMRFIMCNICSILDVASFRHPRFSMQRLIIIFARFMVSYLATDSGLTIQDLATNVASIHKMSHSKNIPYNIPRNIPQNIPKTIPQNIPQNIP